MQSDPAAARVVEGLRRLVQALRTSAHVAERDLGVSGAQLFVLGELAAEPGMSLRRLSQRTLTDPSSVSVVVARLEERGLVKRRRDEDDGRRSVLELTVKGHRLRERTPEPLQVRLIVALQQMPATEVRRFGVTLQKLVEAAGATSDGGVTPFFFEESPRLSAKSLGTKTAKTRKAPATRSPEKPPAARARGAAR